MSTNLRRNMIAATGAGWAVTTDTGEVKFGRWATREEATEHGLIGVYLFSGDDVVEVDAQDRPMVTAWADDFDTWHVRVARTVADPRDAASARLFAELGSRGTHLGRGVWAEPVPVPEMDDAHSVVYREGPA